MWPGQQPPGGEQNPQDQNPNPYQQSGYQQPNPYQQPGPQQPGYQQPGYQQPNPYQQQPGPGQWGAATAAGAPEPPGGGGKSTKIVAIVAATAVVVTAAVTGIVVLGGDKDDEADGKTTKPSATASKKPSESASADNPRGTDDEKPTIPGWKVVINPKWGTAFDVPAEWAVRTPGTFIGFEDAQKDDGSAVVGMSAPAFLKENWCTFDEDKDGTKDETELAAAGTKGQSGAKSTAGAARSDSATWAWAGYTDQTKADEKKIVIGKAKDFTSKSGLKGSIATSYTRGVKKDNKCDTEGKATTFAFKNSAGDFASFTFYGVKGVRDEVPDELVQKIAGTVRLHGEPES